MSVPSPLRQLLLWAAVATFSFAGVNSIRADSSSRPETGEGSAEDIWTYDPKADAPSTARMLMIMAREEHEAGYQGRALRHFRTVIREHSTSSLAPEAHFQSALIRLERRQWTKAFNHFQEIVDGHPGYWRFRQVIRQQYEIADALRRGARLRLFWVVPGFRSPERAVEYFEQVVENAPYSDVAPDALLKAARLQAKKKKLDEAIDLYDRFISDYPDHEGAADAYFGLAEAFATRVKGPEYDQGANREAISYYEDFVILHPQHPRAAEADERIQEMRDLLAQSRVLLGDFYFKRRGNLPAARVFYNEAISISPVSPSAEEAREKLRRVEERAEGE